MAIREIRKKEDGILQKKCRPIEKIDDRILQILDDMKDTLYAANGVGLAAPQVGILKQLVVIDVGDGLIELINPVITKSSGSQIDTEGCLSVPGIWGEVERPNKVTVEALDREGNKRTYHGEGLLARAFCHEIDHLSGHLFLEKVIRFIDPNEQ